MLQRKICILLMVLTLILGTCAVGYASEPTITVTNEARTVELVGTTIQYPGTVATISVWYPDTDADSLTEQADIKNLNAYTSEATVSDDNSYSLSFELKPEDPSGRYTVNVFIPGDSEPQEYYFDYRNITRANSVLSVAQTQNAAAIKNALETGFVDISVAASERYFTYSENKKDYVASYVEANRAVSLEELEQTLITAVEKLDKTELLTKSTRSEIKAMLETDRELFTISAENMTKYSALNEDKKDEVIVLVSDYIQGSIFPENVSEAFAKALEEVQESEPDEDDDNSSGSSGGGGGGGGSRRTNSVAFSPELIAPVESKEKAPVNFVDIETVSWAKNAINILADREIINGKSESEFYPNDYIKREELLKILVSAFKLRAASAAAIPFEDVERGAWYYDSVATAYNLGLTNGTSETMFGINTYVSRQDMAVFINNVLNYMSKELEAEKKGVVFSDDSSIAEYAKGAVNALYEANIINGREDGGFDPHAGATRAEAAKVIYQILYKLNML